MTGTGVTIGGVTIGGVTIGGVTTGFGTTTGGVTTGITLIYVMKINILILLANFTDRAHRYFRAFFD